MEEWLMNQHVCVCVFHITGQLCTSIVSTPQLSAGSGSAVTDHQAGSVRESVLEHIALHAALDRCRRLGGGVGRSSVAQCHG